MKQVYKDDILLIHITIISNYIIISSLLISFLAFSIFWDIPRLINEYFGKSSVLDLLAHEVFKPAELNISEI